MLRYTLFLILFLSTSAMATPASDTTIKQLLTVTRAQRLLDSMRGQVNSLMERAIQASLQGKQPSAKQKQAITRMKHRMIALLHKGLSWEKLEPVYIRLYKDTFSEEELSGMLAFYKTPAGQAVINKMPVLMRKSMLEMQRMTAGLTPEMQKIQHDFVADMAAAQK
jgi:hypothetical protein